MFSVRFFGFCLATFVLATVTSAQSGDDAKLDPPDVTTLPKIPAAVHQSMQSREFATAVKAIEAAINQDDQNDKDYLQYLKGIALTEQDRLDEAIEAFDNLAETQPNSRWRSRAEFGKANVFVRRRQYIEAGEIYRAEAERLLSRERKDELAAIYLEFADKYYRGVPADDPSEEKKPDFKQALTYYQEAVKLKPTTKLLQKIRFRIARCLEETGSNKEAIAAYESFLADYASADPAADLSLPAAREAETRFRLGAVQLKSKQLTTARRTWQDFLASAEKSDEELSPEQVDFLAKAEYRIAHTYGLPLPASIGDLELGVAAAQRFLNRNPGHELAPLAELEIAQGYTHHGRHGAAVESLRTLIGNPDYAESDQLPIARRMLGQSYFSQKLFDDAIESWSEFLDRHPTDPQWPSVQQWIVNAEYAKAQDARQRKEYDVARNVWQTFLNKYPLDNRAAGILYQFGQMKYADAVERHVDRIKAALDRGDSPQSIQVDDRCEKLFREAIADWRRVTRKYPSSNEASQASFMIGVTLEDRLGQLAEALDAYKGVKGRQEGQAKQRITRLTSPQLEIMTERKFRSDEKARIKLTTRNLENVTVKAYRIDMADYFRKMHLASGIETLDIALIDPDSQFEHSVERYQQYQRIDSDVEVPVEGVGVTAVTVSSEKLEVTTMVVVSDLDVIVKSSRNELFLFAENMLTGKPVVGASVLISDGSDVFAEVATGQDGVLQESFDELKSATDLRVFAIHEGHVASTVNNLNGLDFAVGLTPRGYLYSDRPAYRAGQLVNVKGVVRWVDSDRFTFQPGEKFKLDVYDARGRQIHSKQVALNGYGTINDHLVLPDTAPQGDYRVHLHRTSAGAGDATGSLSFETSFKVTEYRLEPVQVSIDLDKDVYFRGDEVNGSISVKYYYGTPLAGERIQYSFGPDGETVSGTTDAQGKVDVKLTTKRFSESQPLNLAVQYPDRGLVANKTVFLATRGFEVGVDSPRDVYISGETFDSVFKVTDPAGKSVQTDLKIEVFRQIRQNGADGEKLLQTHKVATDADSGEARKTLAIEEGGFYIVRASGVDQFDNQVSGQMRIRISGDKDSVRLRILAEKHAYVVGETAKIRLHWREQPALALLTFEGAKVLSYRLVDLKQGENAISVPMHAELAPNFFLSVAVMERNRFHTASSGFQVTQRLRITLKPDQETLRPGEDLRVAIEVTDPQGNPVESEISLAMVQSNLLESFGDVQGAIDAFFGAGLRRPSVRQMTSCTFSYRPTTRAVSQFLLAEADRRSTLEREVRALADARSSGAWATSISREWLDSLEANALPQVSGGAVPSFGGFAGQMGQDGASISSRGITTWDDSSGNLFNDIDGEQMDSLADAIVGGQLQGIVLDDFGTASGVAPIVGDFAVQQQPAGFAGSMTFEGRAPRRQRAEQQLQRGGFGGTNRFRSSDIPTPDNSRLQDLAANMPQRYRRAAGTYYEQLSEPGASVGGPGPGFLGPEAQNDWFGQLSQRDKTVNALTGKGKFLAINGRSEEELRELAGEGGLQLMPGMAHAETAFWDPVIITDDAGKAEVIITMPTRSTAWRLRAKGIDQTSLAGQATADVITKKDLFGEMKLPLAFTAGDKAWVPVEVHNSLEGARGIDVTLQVTLGDRTVTQTKQVDVQGPGISRIGFETEIAAAEEAVFELSVASGEDNSDQTITTAKVVPYGFPVYESASGTSSQSTIALVKFDDSIEVEKPTLEILIGANVNRSLIESVVGGGVFPMDRCGLLHGSGLERSVSDVLGGVAIMKMIGVTKESDTPETVAVVSKITGAISALVSSQRDDGGWSWSGRPDSGTADPYLSSRVMWALSSARASGFAVAGETFDKGKAFLRSEFSKTSSIELGRQTILLHAMAESDCADFSLANRLYRERNRLSNAGLIHLALALSRMNHDEMASQLLALVEVSTDARSAGKATAQRAADVIPWMQSGIELRAIYLLALQRVNPRDAMASQLADWLMAARVGSRWPVEKSNGPAIAALAQWHGSTRLVSEKYKLTIYVNEAEIESFTVDPSKEGSRRVEVPAELVASPPAGGDVFPAGTRIRFDLEGRGTFSYSAILAGFVPAEKLKSNSESWTVGRRYEPARRMVDGREIPRGFDVVNGSYRSFYNPLTQLPVGQRAEVTLTPRRRGTTGRPGEQYDYLVLTEPIPAGCTVLDGSVSGDFERFEITPGKLTFYIGAKRYPGDIRYKLVGYVPGNFLTAQSLLRSFYDPTQMAIATVKPLQVLKADGESTDEYRLTPDELYHLGQLELQKSNHDAAHEHLTALLDNWRLDSDKYKNAVQWLFHASLEKESHGEIVKYFEVIKEKFPTIELTFEQILQVASSYRELGEYERSYLVYRSTVEASFERESQVAGFLNARGEFIRSVAAMERLLSDYPAESYVATATYALAQEVYRRAPEAKDDTRLAEQGLTRVHLINGSIQMLDHFVSTWPNDPADDQASFALATALLDLDQYDAAIDRCQAYTKRYPDSRLLDSFWYMIGYSHFELEHHQEALEMCQRVASASFAVPETGGTREADNKWEAVYIMGQVYHSLGKAAEAILQYTQVKQRFADAAEAIEFFSRKEIRLDEITTIEPNQAKQIELDFRNIPDVAIKVYRIDLMKFGLMQRNLDRITAINLAGIKPYHEETVSLGDGKDYRDRSKTVELPLKDEGAYLVVCRGENLYTSGLVLVSPLALSVSEDVASGRVRVTVKNATDDKFVDDVQVKVIGSANSDFQSGSTDLRGLFVADDIQGTSTVIAQVDNDQYAFFRGELAMQGVVPPSSGSQPSSQSSPASQEAAPAAKSGKQVLRGNLFNTNGAFQMEQKGNYEGLLNNDRKGIESQEAY